MSWTSPSFPDVVVPYEPFPGSIGVLPSAETVALKLEHHATEVELYGASECISASRPDLKQASTRSRVGLSSATCLCRQSAVGGQP